MIYNFIVWQASNGLWCLRIVEGTGEVIAEGFFNSRWESETVGLLTVSQLLGVSLAALL